MTRAVILALVYTLSCNALAGPLPDPKLTPGKTDPRVTQATIGKTICVPGYTLKVRKTTEAMKREVARRYGLPWSQRAKVEFDHFLNLGIGGADDVDNLWPMPYAARGKGGARDKDVVEHYLQRQVCEGEMTLKQAQSAIRNWQAIYRELQG